jgi:hypothetical protein
MSNITCNTRLSEAFGPELRLSPAKPEQVRFLRSPARRFLVCGCKGTTTLRHGQIFPSLFSKILSQVFIFGIPVSSSGRRDFIGTSIRLKRRVDEASTIRRLTSNDTSLEPQPYNVRVHVRMYACII